MRKIWNNYEINVDGIVFICDVSDPSRFPEAQFELEKVIERTEDKIPILIFGNKIDKKILEKTYEYQLRY